MNYGIHDRGVLRARLRASLPDRWFRRADVRMDELGGNRRFSESVDAFARDLLQRVAYTLPISASDDDVCALADELAKKYEQLNGCSGVFEGLARAERARDLLRFGLSNPGRARLGCARWWKRNLRHRLNYQTEIAARSFGYVGGGGDRYVSQESYRRSVEAQHRNQAAIEAAEIENEEGDRASLGDAVKSSVSNPEIRRAELMTRVRGFEEIAAGLNHIGVFLTATLPSRFHPVRANGSVNVNFDGSSVVDGQRDLSAKWVKFRAICAKEKVRIYGFRVAEPHKSGTVHWHLLLFCDCADKKAVIRHFVRLFRDSDEVCEGETRKHRVKIKTMNPLLGGAAAYIAKYIAKNIDGAHMEEKDKVGAKRVRAWASVHRIRQFQQFGGAKVGIWRELRRVNRDELSVLGEAANELARAVHRTDDDRADWAAFNRLCGAVPGVPVRVSVSLEHTHSGRLNAYSEVEGRRLYGVRVGWVVFPTRAKRWRVVWKSRSVVSSNYSRTRFNNCNSSNELSRSKVGQFGHSFGALTALTGEVGESPVSGVKSKRAAFCLYGDSS